MKRYYFQSSIVSTEGGFGIQLDGRNLCTPAQNPLILPTENLAKAIAAEWQAQGEEVKPDSMRLMRLVSTALDRVAVARDPVIDATASYGATDLLCYRAEEPPGLAERQARIWQPILDWAALRFDAPLMVTAGVIPITQPADSLRALRAVLADLDVLTLTAVADLTPALGSLILALALLYRRIDAGGAMAASRLDEAFQNERWGEDYEATDRRLALEADVQTGARFLDLLRD